MHVLPVNLMMGKGVRFLPRTSVAMQKDFRFGVATADHQCEAYNGQDDVRDVWERVRGLTPRGKATDFWHRYREDVDLAKGLGCRAFRLSLSWARLEPEAGASDESAFAHYRDVLQYMRDAGMATVVTLHHNTWPLWVQAVGDGAGLLDAGFPARMSAYAGQVAKRLGDLIDYYVTLNEPNQLVYGFIKGFWMRSYPVPPGLEPYATSEQQMDAVLKLIPNLFRAHAQARKAIHAVHPEAKVGSNPLVLGLPRWLQHWIDRNATHLKSPEQALRQAARLSQRWIVENGKVDISLAQVAMTQERMNRVLFSEPYATARPVLLHAASLVLPADFQTWKICVGVIDNGPTAARVGGLFTAAQVEYFVDPASAAAALRAGKVDVVFDLDLLLKQYAIDGFVLSPVQMHGWPVAVVTALGKRALLNAVDRALRDYKSTHPELPRGHNRKTIAHVGREGMDADTGPVPDLDGSLKAIRKRGLLRVGIRPGIEGLCMPDGAGGYTGLEPDLARHIARFVLGTDSAKVRFVALSGDRRWNATRSFLSVLDDFRKSLGMFGTLVGTNWWNLGMAGKLPHFLCPTDCVGALDYVGIDYYWGISSIWPGQIQRLSAAAECHYAMAPVWPGVLDGILHEAQEQFRGKPIIVIENGCVTSADGFSRAKYLKAHIDQIERARRRGTPIEAYLCWSITSNREWGLPFDDNSDFGLFHIDLDHDPNLTRVPTEASKLYAQLIASDEAARRK
jgi:beta-glucosidase/6-phospho-beta-glucosidase/beta-galactosidase/ABC-type amino acid transport substrate-binding protein